MYGVKSVRRRDQDAFGRARLMYSFEYVKNWSRYFGSSSRRRMASFCTSAMLSVCKQKMQC